MIHPATEYPYANITAHTASSRNTVQQPLCCNCFEFYGVPALTGNHVTELYGSGEQPNLSDFPKQKMASAAVTSESQASDADQPKLSDLIDNGWKLYEEVESTNEPTSSLPIQVKIKRGVSKLEEATRMVAQLDLFRYHPLASDTTPGARFKRAPGLDEAYL